MSWSWETYRLDLLSRIEQAPPLMRSVWEPRANRLDWLAPAFFPLPTRIIPPRRADAPNDLQDASKAATAAKQHKRARVVRGIPFFQTNIEARAGLPASIFRSSLIASLLTHTPAQQQRFFGLAFTDLECPTVGYINIQEIPPWSPTLESDEFLFMPTILERSLPYLDARNSRPSDVPKAAERVPSSRAEALAFPDVFVLDATGWHGEAIGPKLKYLMAFARTSASQHIIDQITVITLTDKRPSNSIPQRTAHQDRDVLIYVDAPSSLEEYNTFLLAWERWRAARDSPRALKSRVQFHLNRLFDALSRLNMALPHIDFNDANATLLTGDEAELCSRNLATFGIVSAIVAMQRDGQDPQDMEELCHHLCNRFDSQTISDIERVMRSYLMALGFVEPEYSPLRDGRRGATVVQIAQQYDLIGEKYLDVIASGQPELIAPPEIAQDVLFDLRSLQSRAIRLLDLVHDNPLLTSMFTLETMPNDKTETLRLTAERLGIAFLAHEAISAIKRNDSDFSSNILFSYAGCLPLDAWEHFIDTVFAHLCESGLANLAHGAVLNDFILYCLHVADSNLFKRGKAARRRILSNMLVLYGIQLDPESLHDDAVNRDTELWIRATSAPYIDAIVHASLRYNLRIHGTPPSAWKWWVGHDEEWQAYDFVQPLDDAVVTEHVSYLHELLHAPIPTCDNAALLLRSIDEL